MCVPTSEVGYTLATTRRGDHEVHKGHVVAWGEEKKFITIHFCISDSREESAAAAAAAHSGRSVISVGESLKISVMNDAATSVRHVRGLYT
jgi:hypothetical protein